MSAPPHADPDLGVFETMLVLGGRPVALDAHLDRLSASLAALYGSPLPTGTRTAVEERSGTLSHGRLRLTVSPGSAQQLRSEISTQDVDPAEVFPTAERSVVLRSFELAGGLGEHKWADRGMLERFASGLPAGELPLLIDTGGSALEAERGSVFLAGPDWLATPPTDGRILPSIARDQAIAVARKAGIEVHERPLSLNELRNGSDVFIAGSVRGIEPVRRIDGTDLPVGGAISARIATDLRHRWTQAPPAELVATGAGERRAGRPAR
jgi:para-aminobenzoate synthetase/4-amino-4-deoxychorismate lyase